MSLSLEIKKFLNDEHTGEYATIYFPVEAAPEQQPQRSARPFGGGKSGKSKRGRDKSAAASESVFTADFYAPQGDDIPDMPTRDAFDDVPDMPAAFRAERTAPVYGAQGDVYDPFAQSKSAYEQPAEGERPPRPAQAAPAGNFEPIRIHYFEAGRGEPLMLVHTVGQSYYTWRNVFFRLSEYYRVFAIDLPGHGYSDRPAQFGYGIEDYALALRLFMDAVGVQSAHFAAFSMGCAYVAQLSLMEPERVGRMMLIAPGGLTNEMPTPVKLIDSAFFGPIASLLYGMGTVRKLLEESFFDLTNINDEVVEQYYRPASDGDGRRAIRYSLHYFDDTELRSHMREIRHPVLIIQGNEDKWHKTEELELFHAAIRTAGFAVVRNAGHLMHEEKPDRMIAAMLEFIPVPMPGGE